VKSIIEAHGGTIELKSEKNKGSEFIIRLKNGN
jgi:signal transduction histidine kinase